MLKTICMMIATAYRILKHPGPMLHIMDTKENVHRYSFERLAPMIRDNKYLQERIEDVKPKKKDTTFMKKFYGGHLNLVGAQSTTGLIFSTIKYLNLDEVDSYPLSIEEKGSVIKLAESRLAEVDESQIIAASSPGNAATSIIMPLFLETDQRYYNVPCPHCDEGQVLEWGGPDKDFGIKWKNNDPATAYYLCAQCQKEIYNRDKYWMNSQGVWIPKKPEVELKPGFHISRLYSPAVKASWENLAADFINANNKSKAGDNEDLKVFINNVLAELWNPKYNTPKEEVLLQRVEPYYPTEKSPIPKQICFITAFVDVQPTWLELKIKGWGIGEESWLLVHRTFEGNTAYDMVWNELDRTLIKPFVHPLGFNLFISAIGVDTGFNSDKAYEFVKNRLIRKLSNGVIQKFFATKGWNTPWKPITDFKTRTNTKGGVPLYMVGTDTAKEVIFNRLSLYNKDLPPTEQSGPGVMHFNYFATSDYFKGLLSEGIEMDRRTKVLHFVKTFERNEPLDCEVGNLFLLRLSRANLIKLTEDINKKSEQLKQGSLFEEKTDQPTRKNWAVDGWR